MTVWDGVNRLIDAADSLDGLRAHALHLLAARRWREQHRPVPDTLLAEEREAAVVDLAAMSLLMKVRGVLDGPVLIVKGPEVAARYPAPGLRPFRDLDLLVPSAVDAQRALLAAGFVSAGSERKFAHHHHQTPLLWPGLPLAIELHESFWVPPWTTLLPNTELFANAIPSRVGVPGLLTLPALYHPILLAAHSWQHVPLRRVLDLVDVAVMSEGLDAEELNDAARRLNLARVWKTTVQTIDALLLGKSVRAWPLRLWARHLLDIDERSMRRQRLTRWLGAWWAPNPTVAVTVAFEMIRGDAASSLRWHWAAHVRKRVRHNREQAPF